MGRESYYNIELKDKALEAMKTRVAQGRGCA